MIKRVWIPTEEVPDDKRKVFHTFSYPVNNVERTEFIRRDVGLEAMNQFINAREKWSCRDANDSRPCPNAEEYLEAELKDA